MIVIQEFSKKIDLPIKIDEIADFIKNKGFVGRIVYHPFDMDPRQLAGMLLHDKPATIAPPYLSDEEVANIAYSTQLSREEQRLVKTKELLHICDVANARVGTRSQVSDLVTWFSIPPDARNEMARISPGIISDHLGIVLALAVLFPAKAREVLKPHFDCGNLNEAAIAALAHIPKVYVRLIMKDVWPELIETLQVT
jgi:hypothetical protein